MTYISNLLRFSTMTILFVIVIIASMFLSTILSPIQTITTPYIQENLHLEALGPPKPPVLVEFTGGIEHIFFHPLIAYPEKAFDFDYQAKGFDDYFVTIPEFDKIIQTLYDNQYILVRIEDIYEEIDGVVKKKPLFIPEGKKPLIISIDDANYYDYMRKNGIIHKLVIDNDGFLATYSIDPQGNEVISRKNEVMPALDEFVRKNPDFSFNGAKGIIALTGYEGILGYRTHSDSENRQDEIIAVKPIIQKLKESGWTFASHGYGHYAASQIGLEKLKSDTYKWKDEVETLIGPSAVYIYPFGDTVKVDSPKFNMLCDSGFKIFAGVGGSAYYRYTEKAVVTQRRHIDGIALRRQRDLNIALFDANEVIDSIRPKEYQ